MELVRAPRRWATFLKKNGYILHNCIGSGSFGDVFAVTKVTTGIKLAMKRLVARRNIAGDKYVMGEIEALMELDHPNIIALEEVLLCDKLACIVLELAPCGNLEMMLARCSLTADDAFIKTAFGQMISAIDYCHSLDLAHRDINPSNILIFPNSLVKLADFGLCFRCCDATTGNSILCSDYLGQDSYLAPEVKLRQPFSAKPADIWSLGCVLFFMVNSINPPAAENDFMTILAGFSIDILLQNDCTNSKHVFVTLIGKMCLLNGSERPKITEVILPWVS